MKVVIQRVLSSSVKIDSKIVAEIQKGLLILVGIEDEDNQEDILETFYELNPNIQII